MTSHKLLALLLGALMVAGSLYGVAGEVVTICTDRVSCRQRCYERCMDKWGWKPICVYSPGHPTPTSHMPQARWVMPNFCTMKCQERYARYGEYAKLATRRFVEVPAKCKSKVQEIYFDWSLDLPKCTKCPSL